MRDALLQIVTSDGRTIVLPAEVASTRREVARGLIGRHLLPDDRAMILDLGETAQWTVTMVGMSFPIDVVLVDEHGRPVHALSMVPGQEFTGIASRWIAEMSLGSIRRFRIDRDARLTYVLAV